MGVSDASVKDGNGRHAWIITTGSNTHFLNEQMMIKGMGPVAGHLAVMSSARVELHGQTALAIMTRYLTNLHNVPNIPVSFICDNQEIVQGCSSQQLCRQLGKHRFVS